MSTSSETVRIKEFVATTSPGIEEIRVKVPINNAGDVDIFDGITTTNVKFVLTQAVYPEYKFKNQPICVYQEINGTGDCDTNSATTMEKFPSGWSLGLQKSDRVFTLKVPELDAGLEFKYKLFLEKTTYTGPVDIVVDPRIKNGGSSLLDAAPDYVGQSIVPWKSPADFSAEALVFLAFAILIAGIGIGRAWAGRIG